MTKDDRLLVVTDLTKRFDARDKDAGVLAVDSLSFSCRPGELLGLIGPSGCGKSTTLRMIAGLERPTRGRIELGGSDITRVPASQRGIGLGFETYALYPPMNAYDNIAFNLRARRLDSREVDRRVREVAERIRLQDVLHEKPAALSSGQKQRVNLARALVRRPRLLLLDEPLSHLDGLERRRLRAEIKAAQKDWNITTILVTHDQEEAAALADRIAVLNNGVLQQIDAVQKLFDAPANLFTAGFIGDPPMNIWSGSAAADGNGYAVWIEDSLRLRGPLPEQPASGSVWVGARPHDTRVVPSAEAHVVGEVVGSEFLGEESHARVSVGGISISVYGAWAALPTGTSVGLRFGRSHVFDAKSGHRLASYGEDDCRWEILDTVSAGHGGAAGTIDRNESPADAVRRAGGET